MSDFIYDEVYLTEKDSQVEALAPVLGCQYTQKWYPAYSKDKKIAIVPLQGHLLSLLQYPHDYDPAYKDWNEDTVFCFPQEFKRVPSKRTFELLNRAVDHLKKAKKIIIATDFDNEGATLAMTVIEYAKSDDRISHMLEMGSMDENALRNAVKNPIEIPFREMAKAGNGRAYIDWVEGMSLSRALSIYLGRKKVKLIFGGVKSPVMNIVVERDLEFESHNAIKFWYLTGTASAKDKKFEYTVYRRSDNNKNFDKKENAEKIKELVTQAIVSAFTKKVRKEGPSQLYDLTSLSAELARKFNLSPEQSLEICQKHYDQYKIQSYPRTAIKFLKEEEYAAVKDILTNLKEVMYKGIIDSILSASIPKRKSVFNSAEVTSHGAIVPVNTDLSEKYKKLSKLEKETFDMVCTRYISNFMEDYEYEEIAGEANINDDYYITFKEKRPLKAGFKLIDANEDDDNNIVEKIKNYQRILPDCQKGDIITIESINLNEGETKPKPRFTMETLLKGMESISNLYPDDAVIKEFLGKNGIGTPATRSAILKDLMTPGDNGEEAWLVQKGKAIVSTERARNLIKVVPKEIVSPVKRAKMNQFLKEVEKGSLSLEKFLDIYRIDVQKDIDFIKELSKDPANLVPLSVPQDVDSLGTCPVCGNGLIIEKEKAYICTNASWKKLDDGKWENSGCQYNIRKAALERFGKGSISKLEVKTLLQNGKVKVKLTSKSNAPYEKDISVDSQWGVKVNF